MEDEKLIFCGNDKQYLSESLTKYSDKSNGAAAFRIPSLIKSGNTLIAAINAQNSAEDWGYIGLAVRTSDDGGETWSDIKIIACPPARRTKYYAKSYSSAFFINPCMSVAKNGDVIMLAEFYPECKSPDNKTLTDKKKIPYSMHNKKMYPLIYDRDGRFYLVGENGIVLDSKYNETDYRVTDWKGSLFKGDDYVGNIYLNGKSGEGDENSVVTFGAPLKAPKRNYIFMFRSTDNGKTWGMQFKLDDGLIGPTKNKPIKFRDKIIMPSSREFHASFGWSSCFEIVQLDNIRQIKVPGSIFYGAIQPAVVRLQDGTLKAFMRSRCGYVCQSSSPDGTHWSCAERTKIPNPNSGLDAIALKDGKIALACNPTKKSRNEMALFISCDGGQTWKKVFSKKRKYPQEYPSIIESRDGKIHLIYTRKRHIWHIVLERADEK